MDLFRIKRYRKPNLLSLVAMLTLISYSSLLTSAELYNFSQPRIQFEDTAYDLSSYNGTIADADFDEGVINLDVHVVTDSVSPYRMKSMLISGIFLSHTASINSMMGLDLNFLYNGRTHPMGGLSFCKNAPQYNHSSSDCSTNGYTWVSSPVPNCPSIVDKVSIKPCGYSPSKTTGGEVLLKGLDEYSTVMLSESVHGCFKDANDNTRDAKGDLYTGNRFQVLVEFTNNCGPERGTGNYDGWDHGYCNGYPERILVAQTVPHSIPACSTTDWISINAAERGLFFVDKNNIEHGVSGGSRFEINSTDWLNNSRGDMGRGAILVTSHTDHIMQDKVSFWDWTQSLSGDPMDTRWGFIPGPSAPTDDNILNFSDIVANHSHTNMVNLASIDNSYMIAGTPGVADQDGDGNYTDELKVLYLAGETDQIHDESSLIIGAGGSACSATNLDNRLEISSVATPLGIRHRATASNGGAEDCCISNHSLCKSGKCNYDTGSCIPDTHKPIGSVCVMSSMGPSTDYCVDQNLEYGEQSNFCCSPFQNGGSCYGQSFNQIPGNGFSLYYNHPGNGLCASPTINIGSMAPAVHSGGWDSQHCISKNVDYTTGVCIRGNEWPATVVNTGQKCKFVTGPQLINGISGRTICNAKAIGSAATSDYECLSNRIDYTNNICKQGYLGVGSYCEVNDQCSSNNCLLIGGRGECS